MHGRGRHPVPRSEKGLTLIEVMVAIAVGMILLIALGSMLVGSIRHFKVQDAFSRMQENGAYALNMIGQDVRMAGFYGQVGTVSFVGGDGSGLVTSPDALDCSVSWSVSVERPVAGFPAAAAPALDCISASNFLDGSPILVLRGASGNPVTALETNHFYVQSSPGGGVLFSYDGLTNPATMAAPVPPPWRVKPDGSPALVFPYQIHVYYLRPCSRPTGGGGTCLATDDDGKPIPTLVRRELNGLAMEEQPIAEGVERMSIQYGVDIDGDGFPNRYFPADGVGNWANVVTVRVGLLVRSSTTTVGYDDSRKMYSLVGEVPNDPAACTAANDCYKCAAGVDCGYHRHVFAQTFQARNVSQRLQQ